MCLCSSAECDKPGILTCENDGFIDKTCNCTCPDVVEGFRCEKIISRLMKPGNKQYFVLHLYRILHCDHFIRKFIKRAFSEFNKFNMK